MPRSEPQKAFAKAADEHRHWDDSGWNHHDDAACDRAIKLLNRPSIGIHRVTDWFRGRRRRIAGSPWIGRTVVVLMSLGIIFAGCFGALWLRLGAGPVNLDVVTPWLASAIEENLGHDHTVQVGGTQIERAGRIRIAVRLRDIVVRDKASNIVASAPKAEVRLSGTALIMGRLRAETLRLVGAELAVRITPDGRVIVSTGQSNSPLATGKVPVKPEPQTVSGPPSLPFQASPAPPPVPATSAAASNGTSGLLAALEWLDGLSAKGLDGQSLNEIGLRNGVLTVEDQRNGGVINFNNISLSLRRPLGGGAAFSVGEEGKNGWELKVAVGAPSNGVRSIDISATKVPTNNLLLAARLKDFTYAADMPLSGEFKGEIGRDGLPTYFRGEIVAGKGTIVDLNVPDYPMVIDHADARVEWDAGRRVMVAPFHVNAGANRITLLAHLEPPNDSIPNWQLGLSGGTILLAGNDGEAPSIFNRIAVRVRFDTENRRVLLTQCDISNGEIGIAGSGSIDYSGEARLRLGMAATPMPIAVLKRIWPVLIVPEVREWITERVDRGTVQRLDIAVNAPVHTLVRGGPPIPDDGLSVNFLANGLTVRPVDDMPLVRDADMKGRVSGRTVNINVGQGAVDTPAGRRLGISDLTFEVPDLAPKPAPTKVRFRIDGPVPAAAEVLQSERLREAGDTVIDPNSSKGTVSAIVTLAMPLKNALTKADTTYSISLDLGALAVDKLAMNQKLEANSLKVVADNQGYRVRGDVKIGGQPAALDYRKTSDGDADVRVSATLDDAARARLGVDLGQSLSGAIPIKLTGKIAGGEGDNRDNRFGVEADLTAARIDNLLPGWTKVAGKATKMTFNVIQKPQGTRFEDIVIDGNGTSIKGSLEIDDKNDLVNASFPTFAPSEGDKANLKAERQPDGMLKVTMRGEVFDGRGFIKSAMSGRDPNTKEKSKNFDIDIDAKLGALAGFYGEAVRSIDLKLTRRAGAIRSFSLSGKLGRDTPVIGDLRGRGQGQGQGRDVMYLETGDAGAFFRFTDTYAKMNGGKMWIAVDPPTSDTSPQEGLLNVRDFTIKGEAALDRAVANAPGANSQGVGFSGMRAEFTRQSGQLRVKDGVLRGPTIGATIEGVIDYPVNQVKMSGTFVPLYGLNNMFGQIPIVGLFLGGGSNEGLIGITYEVVGTPGAPVLRVNPISAMAPGVFRKIFDFNTGRQSVPTDFPTPQQ
ncbi:MAG: hypothetical protein ACJAVZ_002359 [Afipia broomeae]|jgi:hypothetical protein|nr:MAG: hypothetical protein EKK35_08705 [Bradyrhizobiaceae bacterium]